MKIKQVLLTLSILLVSVHAFAQVPFMLTKEMGATQYVLKGTINKNLPITMFLYDMDNLHGHYYYDKYQTNIKLTAGEKGEHSWLVYEFAEDAKSYNPKDSSAYFRLTPNDNKFTGTWSNGKRKFDVALDVMHELSVERYVFDQPFFYKGEKIIVDFAQDRVQINGDSEATKKINKQLDDIYKSKTNDFIALYETMQSWIVEDDFIMIGFGDHHIFSLNYMDDKIISMQFWYYEFTGGAHGSGGTYGYTYSLETGDVITLDSIMKTTDDKELLALLKQKMIEYYDGEIDEFESIFLSEKFSVNQNGITFLYDHYDIGAYYMGMPEILITFNELKPYMKENTPINYLFK